MLPSTQSQTLHLGGVALWLLGNNIRWSMDFDIVDRKKLTDTIKQCREQLAPSPHRDALIYEHLGISEVLMRSDARLNRARVHISNRKQYMLARLRYGF